MREVPLSEVKDDLSRYLRLAEKEGIVITRHGRAAGVLIGFASEDDWFDYRLENDPRFLNRIAAARASLRAGRGIRLEDLEEKATANKASAPDRGPVAVRRKRERPRVGPRQVSGRH
jgi:prevent-host-death family protein